MDDVPRGKPVPPDLATRVEGRGPLASLLPVLTVAGTCVGAVLVVFSCAGVPGLLAMLAIGGMAGFIGLQYLAWGWWLGEKIRREELAANEHKEEDK